MKIIHVTKSSLDKNALNGVNKIISQLCPSLNKIDNISSEVWALTNKKKKPFTSFDMIFFSKRKFPFHLSKKLVSQLNILKDDTIFHFHSVFIPEFYTISKILDEKKIQWIISPHGGYSNDSFKKNYFLKSLYFSYIENFLLKRSKYILINNLNEKKNSIKLNIFKKKIKIIPNGIPINKIRYNKKTSDLLNIIYVGRLSIMHKGLDLLINSFKILSKLNIYPKLSIYGDGKDRNQLLKMLNRLDPKIKIILLRSVTGHQKYKKILNSDIFIHSSRWEGMPMAVLEAASLSKPLIISKETNLSNYVKKYECGYVIEKLNSYSIAKVIQKAIKDKKKGRLHALGQNSKKMTIIEFNWSKISNEMVNQLYNQVK